MSEMFNKRSPSRQFVFSAGAVVGLVTLAAFTVLTSAQLTSASDTQKETPMNSSSAQIPTPEGPGSVWGAPNLPTGFTDTFTSQYIDTGDVTLHAVIGGDGPPLLLIHGWPETWYAWRLVMPTLAQDFTVIAVDQRGIGLSDKPADGYDTGTLAKDMVALMDALGYDKFAVVGHDTGFTIGYALAADFPDRIDRVALAEIPGPPLPSASPPVFVPGQVNNKLWHIPFNRVDNLPEQLIAGREDIFFGYEFAIQGGKLPDDLIKYYISLVSNPDSLRGSLGWYRAFDATLAQNEARKATLLTMPVLAIGGETSYGDHVGGAMKPLANDVQTVVIPGAGHWVAEQAPEALLEALTKFLAPYREAVTA
jgi:pimeloyl-ACP methyl ester carboxylesterase